MMMQCVDQWLIHPLQYKAEYKEILSKNPHTIYYSTYYTSTILYETIMIILSMIYSATINESLAAQSINVRTLLSLLLEIILPYKIPYFLFDFLRAERAKILYQFSHWSLIFLLIFLLSFLSFLILKSFAPLPLINFILLF